MLPWDTDAQQAVAQAARERLSPDWLESLLSGGQVASGYVGAPPVQAGELIPSLPKSRLEALLMGGMMAAPVIGQAAWRMRGAPKAAIEAVKGLRDPMAIKDTVFHSTNLEGLRGILREGVIRPSPDIYMPAGETGASPGVSVSRVPRVASKAERPITFVLGGEAMPPARPYTEFGYRKETYQPVGPGRLEKVPNPHFEFENRTYGEPVPASAIREVWVDKDALGKLARRISYEGQGLVSPADVFTQHINAIQTEAAAAGLPVRIFESGGEMHSARAAMSKKK